MTVLEVIQRSTDFLAKKGVESPRLQVELMLAAALGMPRLKLYLNFEQELAEAQLELVREQVRRRGNREPLQHILGSVSFCGREIKVNRHVLVPRPETELLAERGWEFLKARIAAGIATPRAIDLGSGSGCIAIALALECPATEIHAVDVSPEALAMARENAELNGCADRLQFHLGDAFGACPAPGKFDLMITNPPYIADAEVATLEPEVRDHDPRLALAGGTDGLDFYRKLAANAGTLLRPDGCLLCEFGDGQAEQIRAVFVEHKWVVASVEPDYTGRQRIMAARYPSN
ncbi:MAG TPA: peptide chain release factor N(5)-glutamine methyltransferase [Verrucomicrobiae bacterium]|nr:peptide chain release factor N(5)-glutamine methyltransferase [Verrucomicrobiae bacterium]